VEKVLAMGNNVTTVHGMWRAYGGQDLAVYGPSAYALG
jgi:hypothetical protein